MRRLVFSWLLQDRARCSLPAVHGPGAGHGCAMAARVRKLSPRLPPVAAAGALVAGDATQERLLWRGDARTAGSLRRGSRARSRDRRGIVFLRRRALRRARRDPDGVEDRFAHTRGQHAAAHHRHRLLEATSCRRYRGLLATRQQSRLRRLPSGRRSRNIRARRDSYWQYLGQHPERGRMRRTSFLGRIALSLLLASAAASNAAADPVDDLLKDFAAQGAGNFSAQAGERLWDHAVTDPKSGEVRRCSLCHGDDLPPPGRHATPGKAIEPLAPSVNPKRLANRADIEKWLLRNCKWTLGRECTPQ